MLLIQPRRFLRKVYPKALWHLDRREKTIYLTFDDGPIPGITEWVLDELDNHKAKATFFCVGANILKNHGIYTRILESGHSIGNHSMFHSRGFSTRIDNYMDEANACQRLIGNNLFRPPYGQMKRGQYKSLINKGYKVVMWDVISYDYEKIAPERCLSIVLNNTRNGSIVVFHDNYKAEQNLKYTLPKTLEHFKNLGYSFKALDFKISRNL
jgi:peptidoglycan/xylan/chitin deacetylase (PgdA/CDA1 family)